MILAIMGVALTMAAEVHHTVVIRDREAGLLAVGREFQRAIASYHESQQSGGKKEYPGSLDDLLQDPRLPGLKRHLRKVYIDPITGAPEWGLTRMNGRIVGVYSLSEKMPIKQANFEAGLEHFEGAKKYSDWVFLYPSDLVIKPSAVAQPASDQAGAAKGVE
ncbi:MAG: type II secretion system protein [Burkholderiales bacterium]|nr:type II secretion system protein [Burkholderiales bacterium]